MFISWPEIESFHSIRKLAENHPELLRGTSTFAYRAKVKLHGTNAAVQIRGDVVMAQSRSKIITPGDDNAGFAAWVESVADEFRTAFAGQPPTILFGEWCGPGIMKGVATNKIPNKVFAVFAAHELPADDDSPLIYSPMELDIVQKIPNTFVLPWFGETWFIPVNGAAEEVQPILDAINKDVMEVEACDPWVKETFGVEGTGEGLVFYPLGADRKLFSDFAFKAKGEKHKNVAKAAPVQLDPAIAESVEQFAAMVLTDARLEQGARVAGSGELVFEMRLMGPFLAWVNKDIEKETQTEMAASGLTWKQVQKTVAARARAWFAEQAERL